MRILITTLLLCISAVLFAQVPASFQGTLNIYQSSGTSPNYEIRGVFNDTQGRYTADSADIGDKIFILDGANCVELEITSIISTTGGILRCNVTDVDAVLVNPPLATGAIMEPTPNYGFPTFVDGISNDLLACIRTHFTLLVDNISSGGGGGITGVPGNTQDTIVQTGHGLSLLNPVFVNASGNWTLSNISDEDSCHMAIVTEVISADTLIITYNGLTTQPGHGYTVGSVYFVQDDGTYATTVPTNFINDIAFYVVSDSTLYITEQRPVSPMTDLNGIYATSDTVPSGTIATADNFQFKWGDNYYISFNPDNDNISMRGDSTLFYLGIDGAIITDNNASKRGLEYAASGYVTQPLSLTTKEYVDNAIAAIPTDNIYTADGTTTDANRVVEVINNISFVDTLTNEFGVKITTPLFSEEVAIGRLDATSGTKATLSESKNNIELRGNATDPLKLAFLEETAQGTNFSVIRARDTLSSNTDFILPNSNGSYAQVLTTDGQGRTSWTNGLTDGDKGDITVSSNGTVWEIDAGAVTTTEILNGTILNEDLATGSVNSSTIQDGTITTTDLAFTVNGGSGAANQVTYWSGTNTLAGNNNFWFNGSKVWINNTTVPDQTFGVSGNSIFGASENNYLQIGGGGVLSNSFGNNTNGSGRWTIGGGAVTYTGSEYRQNATFNLFGTGRILKFGSSAQMQSINSRVGAIISEINTSATSIFQWNFAESLLPDVNGNLTPYYVGLPARSFRSPLGTQNGTIIGALFRQSIIADSSTVTPTLLAMAIEPTFSNNGLTNVNKHGIRYRATTTGIHYAATFNSGLVGIGTETPTAELHIVGAGTTSATYGLQVEDSSGANIVSVRDDRYVAFGATTGGSIVEMFTDASRKTYFDGFDILMYNRGSGQNQFGFFGGNGSMASPTNVASGENLGEFAWYGYYSGGDRYANVIRSRVDSLAGTTVWGRLEFNYGASNTMVTMFGKNNTVQVHGKLGVGTTPSTTSFTKLAASTTANSSLNITAGTQPTNSLDGDVWNNDSQNTLQANEASLVKSLSGTIFTGTADATNGNNASEASITPTGVGTLTLPANALVAGKMIRVTASGSYGTDAVIKPDLEMRLKLGSTVIAEFGPNEIATNTSTGTWTVTFTVTCRTTGVSGTVVGRGELHLNSSEVAAGNRWITPNNNTVTLDTTTSHAITLTTLWPNGADADDTITCNQFLVEILN